MRLGNRSPKHSLFLVVIPLVLVLATAVASAQQIPGEILQRLAVAQGGVPDQPATGGAVLEGSVDPATYRLGPGDRLRIQSIGNAAFTLVSAVDAEGWLSLGEYGSIEVGGSTLDEGRRRIRTRLASFLRDGQVEVRLQEIRRFKVYVLGEVGRPDAYTVTAATRAAEAIAMAGGTSDSASVRGIRILRSDPAAEIPVDLVAFRIAGALEGNPFLSDGDRVVVPRRGRVFGAYGAVGHPGVWDLRDGETLDDVLSWIGLAPDADSGRAFLARFRAGDAGGTADRYDTLGVALDRVLSGEERWILADGDRLYVPRIPRRHASASVRIDGAVNHPGDYPIFAGEDRVQDALAAAGGLLPDALSTRVTLVRRAAPDSVSMFEALRQPAPVFDLTTTEQARLHLSFSPDAGRMTFDASAGEGPLLADGDRIVVPRRSARIEVTGEVVNAGFYAHVDGWEADDYLNAAGGPTRQADKKRIRLLRGADGTATEADKAGALAPGDVLYVPEKSRTARSTWDTVREVFGIAAQVATVVLIIDQLNK
jgi:protein involved in polysaccharide export with SLBB domain